MSEVFVKPKNNFAMRMLTAPLNKDFPTKLSTVNERIEYVRCVLGYPYEVFAIKLKTDAVTMKAVLLGKHEASLKMLHAILKEFPVNGNWLYMGTDKKNAFTADDLSKHVYDENSKIDIELCNRLRIIRDAVGASQEQFAKLLEVGKDTIISIENGRSVIQLYLIKRIVTQFRVNVEWLIFGKGNMGTIKKLKQIPELA